VWSAGLAHHEDALFSMEELQDQLHDLPFADSLEVER
jgi:hypothetical protein